MSDVKMVVFDYGGDVMVQNGDLLADNGLSTAVLISLFSDSRAPADAELPQFEQTLRGWWNDTKQEFIGCLLWLIGRETNSVRREVPARAKQAAQDGLQWMINLGIASAIDVTATIEQALALQLIIKITRGDSRDYQYLWDDLAESEQIQVGNTSVQLQFIK